MILEKIFVTESVLTAFLGLGLLVLSIWKNKVITSEAAWDRLVEKSSYLKSALGVMFFSLIIYMVAESAELLSLSSHSYGLELFHEIGEPVHMFLAVLAILLVLALLKEMLGSENAS
jgi:hypothetical protein